MKCAVTVPTTPKTGGRYSKAIALNVVVVLSSLFSTIAVTPFAIFTDRTKETDLFCNAEYKYYKYCYYYYYIH